MRLTLVEHSTSLSLGRPFVVNVFHAALGEIWERAPGHNHWSSCWNVQLFLQLVGQCQQHPQCATLADSH